MRKRTFPLFGLFLLGCPKEPSSESNAPIASSYEVFRFAGEVRLPPRRTTVPIVLVAPGRPIDLRSLRASISITGTIAATELTMSFSEPSPAGARLSMVLPRGARVERLSANGGDGWREATREPTERSELPEIPLAETEHRFAPVLPAGTREVIVSYTEAPRRRHVLRLVGLPRLESFDASVSTSSSAIHRESWQPDRDLEVPRASAAHSQGDLRPIDSLLVLIDSSASSARDWARRVETLRALIDALGRGSGGQTKIHLAAFDQTYERIYEGELGRLDPGAWQRLLDWQPLGATNLAKTLAWIAGGDRMRFFEHRFSRALLVGDGIATLGSTELEAMTASVKGMSSVGVKRFDALAFGDARDESLLVALVKSGEERGALIDGDLPLEEIAHLLSTSVGPQDRGEASPDPIEPAFFARGSPSAPKKTKVTKGSNYRGRLAEIMPLLGPRNQEALQKAKAWHQEEPFETLPVLVLGEVHAAMNEARNAARAYGSLIDLHPSRAEALVLAGERIETLQSDIAILVALDAFEKAVTMAPERASSHRLLAHALMKARQEQKSFEALERAIELVPRGPAQASLRDDAALIAAAWIRREPNRRTEIIARLIPLGRTVANQPSLSFSLHWEAEVDVDLAITDGRGAVLSVDHDADSFGPEVVTIAGQPRLRSYPFRAEARVYGRSVLGATAGRLDIVEHDGKGGLWFATRTFLLNTESGIADLGSVARPFGGSQRGP